MKKSLNSFFESELNAKCDEQKTDIVCPGYLYIVEHRTTGTCIVVVVIELCTYLFNFSGGDSVIVFIGV